MTNITPRTKGLITAVIMMGLALFFFYVLKKPFDSSYQFIIYTVYAAGIIWCLLDFKKTAPADSKFKDFFSAGFKMFVIVTLIMVFFVLIFFYLNPQITETRLAENNKLLLAEGNHTPAEIEKNANEMKRIFIPMMLGITTFMYLFLGALITAITSAFLSQKK
jgi:Protein of unknown function (DUF4199)